jgi:hypothetical protein
MLALLKHTAETTSLLRFMNRREYWEWEQECKETEHIRLSGYDFISTPHIIHSKPLLIVKKRDTSILSAQTRLVNDEPV